jgi:perosamine synthetase
VRVAKSMQENFRRFESRIKGFFRQFYKVPYCVPAWGWGECKAILKCIFTGHLIKGGDKDKLYQSIKRRTGMRFVFGFNSGQDGIHAALSAFGVAPGDKVILPSYCCETVAKAVLQSGATPTFCDIRSDFNPDVNSVLRLVDSSVKAIIFPHLFGRSGCIDKLERALEMQGNRSEVLVIDDAAQSFGARLNGRLVGTYGDVGVLSFGPGKTMTATGGGLIITNSTKLAESLSQLPASAVGIKDKIRSLLYWFLFRRLRRFTLPFFPFLSTIFRGKASGLQRPRSLCNIDAAIGLEQLKKLDRMLKMRIERKRLLDDLIHRSYAGLVAFLPGEDVEADFHNVATKYIICLRGEIFPKHIQGNYNKSLKESGIEIQELYEPIHFKPGYLGDSACLTNTEKYYNMGLQVPLEPSISPGNFDLVVKTLVEFLDVLKKDTVFKQVESSSLWHNPQFRDKPSAHARS